MGDNPQPGNQTAELVEIEDARMASSVTEMLMDQKYRQDVHLFMKMRQKRNLIYRDI